MISLETFYSLSLPQKADYIPPHTLCQRNLIGFFFPPKPRVQKQTQTNKKSCFLGEAVIQSLKCNSLFVGPPNESLSLVKNSKTGTEINAKAL